MKPHQRHCMVNLYSGNPCDCLEGTDEDTHVMRYYPQGHKFHHEPEWDCWCNPEPSTIYDDGSLLWVHREVH